MVSIILEHNILYFMLLPGVWCSLWVITFWQFILFAPSQIFSLEVFRKPVCRKRMKILAEIMSDEIWDWYFKVLIFIFFMFLNSRMHRLALHLHGTHKVEKVLVPKCQLSQSASVLTMCSVSLKAGLIRKGTSSLCHVCKKIFTLKNSVIHPCILSLCKLPSTYQ